jgi:hypothetical protein
MRALWLAVTLVGCSYPDFDFARADGAPDTAVDDTTTDAFVDDTAIEDSAIEDSAIEDSATTDAVLDTTIDSAKPDTAKPDTAPVSMGCTGFVGAFCADWDKATDPASEFAYKGVSPTASLAVEAAGRSLPSSLVATTSPSSTDTVVTANVVAKVTAPTLGALARIDAWIRPESTTFPTTSGGAFLFKFPNGVSGGDGVTFSMDASGYYVDRIATDYEYFAISTKPKLGVWTHVRMDVKLHTTSGAVTTWIDDMTTPVLTKTGVSTLKTDTTTLILIVGLYSQSGTGTFKVHYDDVSLVWK